MSKNYNTRVQLKNDTAGNWAKAVNFIPLQGEIIIYSDTQQIKIGDGTTSVVNLPFFLSNDITPELFGAIGNGTTDDTEAFKQAIDFMQTINATTLKLSNKKYYLKNLEVENSIKIQGESNTIITGNGGYPCITFDYRSPRRNKVTALEEKNLQTVFTLTDNIPEDVQRGSILKIYANGADDKVPNIRYNSHIGEFLNVLDIDRTNKKITVAQQLRYNYNPANGCVYLVYVENKKVEIDNINIKINEPSTTSNNVAAITVLGGARHSFSNITVIETPETAFTLKGCYGYNFSHIDARYQWNTDYFEGKELEIRQLGYTINDCGGGYYKIHDCLVNNVRHFADTGTANTWQQKFDESGNIIAEGGEISGVSEYGLISNIVTQGASGFALGTHENAWQITYDNVVCNASMGTGFIARGDKIILRNSFVEATTNGLYLANYQSSDGASTANEGNHIFEACTIKVPSTGFAINAVSDTKMNAIFKNCTFYGPLAFNAPDSHYQFYNCQFFNTEEGKDDGINIEAQNVILDFFDCDIGIRIVPRLGKELNFVNCHIVNTFNAFTGGWTDYHLNFKSCVFEPQNETDIMYFDLQGNNLLNIFMDECTFKRVKLMVDMSGDEKYVKDCHKRIKIFNSVIYPENTHSTFMTVRCSCEILLKNIYVMCEQNVTRWNYHIIEMASSKNNFPVESTILRIEADNVTFAKDYMTFNGAWMGGILLLGANLGTLEGYMRNLIGTRFNDILYVYNPDKHTITNDNIWIGETQSTQIVKDRPAIFSGSYNDLKDKPEIATAVTQNGAEAVSAQAVYNYVQTVFGQLTDGDEVSY